MINSYLKICVTIVRSLKKNIVNYVKVKTSKNICIMSHLMWTAQLTPVGTVGFEELTVGQLVKKFPTTYGNWNFITIFTEPIPKAINSATWGQSTPSKQLFRFVLIQSFQQSLGFTSNIFLYDLPPETCTYLFSSGSMPAASILYFIFLNWFTKILKKSENHKRFNNSVVFSLVLTLSSQVQIKW